MDDTLNHWLGHAKKNAGWLLALGIVEIIVGIFAICAPMVAGFATVLMIGVVMIIGGIARIIEAFHAKSFGSGLLLAVIWGLAIAAAGAYLLAMPGVGLVTLTLVAAIGIGIDGILRIWMSFKMRPHKGWGWMLAGGAICVVLAVMIFAQFPYSAIWLVGTLIGISVLFNGITMVSIASAARKLADRGEEALAR